jgi:polysaccharide export outer membrane protein
MQRISGLFLIILFYSSCKVLTPQVMFKTDKNYPMDTAKANISSEYLLSPYDKLEMSLYSIEGYKLVDVTASSGAGQQGGISYIIEQDGKAKLPILGKVSLSGLTMRAAERQLEDLYSKYYINPFILLRVSNRQAYIFFAETGKGVIVNIPNDNMNVIEAIAQAGGISENSKASRIKVLRGDPHNPKVHLIDLSKIESLKNADLSLQSHDIIYIESAPRYSNKVLTQITPVVGILTSVLLIANLFNK